MSVGTTSIKQFLKNLLRTADWTVPMCVIPALCGFGMWRGYLIWIPDLLSAAGFVCIRLVFRAVLRIRWRNKGAMQALGSVALQLFVWLPLQIVGCVAVMIAFYVVGYTGTELIEVRAAKAFLEDVVRSADEYKRLNGRYPEALTDMKLGEMPRLVKLSYEDFQRHPSWRPNPYRRLDDNSISVGFSYLLNDISADYHWTTNDPRWRCNGRGCTTDKEEPSR